MEKYLVNNPRKIGVFLETAHPIKFLETVENAIEKKIRTLICNKVFLTNGLMGKRIILYFPWVLQY